MDATPGSRKAPPAATADAVPSAAQQLAAEQSSSPEPELDAVGAVRASGGEDDDEQVERFYALLDNIRAMRGMVSTGGTAAGRKRAREAEPPWRPAFRMEDFELEEVDSDSAGCAGEKKKKRRRAVRSGRRTTRSRRRARRWRTKVAGGGGRSRTRRVALECWPLTLGPCLDCKC